MKILEHVKCYCTFWKPTVARRISLYFLLVGLIIFFVTSILYMIGGRKQFISTTSKLINDQLSRLEMSSKPDYIWKGIDSPQLELYHLLELLASLSSSFYMVSDLSIYSKTHKDSAWFQMNFPDGPILKSHRIGQDPYTDKLDRWLSHRFRPSKAKIYSDNGSHSMFVNITSENDVNNYFLKIGVNSEGLTNIIHKQMKYFLLFFIVAVIILRFLGYYFARKISGPIEKLTEISAKVAKGDLSKSVPVETKDEIGELSKNFNHMVEGLREWERIKMVEFELEKGQKIQQDFLPNDIPSFPDWNIATCFFPAGKVSGDFYDVFTFPDGNVGLVIADVCDKGVGSALYMALIEQPFNSASELLERVKSNLFSFIDIAPGGDDVTMLAIQRITGV